MGKIFLLSIIVFTCAFVNKTYSQSEYIYAPFNSELNDGQKKKMKKASTLFAKAEKEKKQAKAIEKKYAKLKKKKKKKKYNRKTWEAKKLYFWSAKTEAKAFNIIKKVYTDAINSATFYSKTDEDDAKGFISEADEKFNEAKGKLKKYNRYGKGDYKKMSTSKVQGDLKASRDLMSQGIMKQIKGLKSILAQGKKKAQDKEDLNAWNDAKSVNTIGGYNDYVSNFSSGKYVTQARLKIQELNDIEAKKIAEEARLSANTNGSNRIFKVQISASHTKLSDWTIKNRAKKMTPIEDVYIDGWYKYWAGSFTSYRDALQYKNSLGSRLGAFIVVFEDGMQIEVTDDMKN